MATRSNFGFSSGSSKAGSRGLGSIFNNALRSSAPSTPTVTQAPTQAPDKTQTQTQTQATTKTPFTYQQAVEFMNGPIGSQIPYVARVLRPSNWNNLNSGLKALYLGEVQRAVNDPVGFSLEKLREDVSAYVLYSSIGGNTSKAEAADAKARIDIYVPFLQSQGQSVDDITLVINTGYNTGVIQVGKHFDRVNDYPLIDRIVDVGLNVGLGALSSGLSTGAQIALNSAIAYEQGAKPEDILRGAVGSLLANQIGPLGVNGGPITTGVSVVDDFNQAIQKIGNPELQSAVFNAARQGVYATVTEQDIAKNMAAGAIAGAIATNIQKKYNDPALANAAGEYFQARLAGKTDLEAATAAFSGYATEEERIAAKTKVAEEVSSLPLDQIQALGYKTRDEVYGLKSGEVGSFSQVPSEIEAKEEFKARPGEVGENIIKVTDEDGIVTYEKSITAQTPKGNKVGYTIIYDPQLNEFQYQYRTTGGTAEGPIVTSSKTKPSLTTPDAPETILPPRLAGAQTGQRTQGVYGGEGTEEKLPAVVVPTQRDPQDMDGLSLVRKVRTGTEVDEGGKLPPVEVPTQREPEEEDEREKQRLITESTQETQQEQTQQETPEVQRPTNNTVLLGLLGGNINLSIPRTQPTPNKREAASMQALSQALSVGDPGDALFGSGLGRRRNVWNVESLRLKDELGG